MNDSAIVVEELGKRYRIGRGREHWGNFREALMGAAKGAVGKLAGAPAAKHQDGNTFWALKDVSFAVKQGEILGIIGRNGSGKSTLLKILSRITEPTTGGASIQGRVSSILEIGTGFHPELTGRENVYLNGALLGMTRSDIERKFDKIVRFSGVEDFLDMPVKRYSSGMYVRLAFSVAAHLEPEVLLLDEVLAVGDAEFVRKCQERMQSIIREGRTVVLVSHDLDAVKKLCTSTLLLEKGQIEVAGESGAVIERYQALLSGRSSAGS